MAAPDNMNAGAANQAGANLAIARQKIFDYIARAVRTADGQKLIPTSEESKAKLSECDTYLVAANRGRDLSADVRASLFRMRAKCLAENFQSANLVGLAKAVAVFKTSELRSAEPEADELAASAAIFTFMVTRQSSQAGLVVNDPQAEDVPAQKILNDEHIEKSATTLYGEMLKNSIRSLNKAVTKITQGSSDGN